MSTTRAGMMKTEALGAGPEQPQLVHVCLPLQ